MKISNLLSPVDVMVDIRTANKSALLRELADKAAANLKLRVDQVAPLLLKREDLGSTGIGRGVAIPHARLPELDRPFGLLAKLKQPIEFDALVRIDTPGEADYYRNGGILQYVLRSLV